MLTWLTAWVAAQVVASIVIVASGYDDPLPIPILAITMLASWTVYGIAVWAASARLGSGEVRSDLGLTFCRIDLIGVPTGVAIQLVAVPLLYVPLRAL